MDIKVSVKRSTPHSAKVRCISISTPDNRDGAIRAIERVVRLMTEHKPPGLAQVCCYGGFVEFVKQKAFPSALAVVQRQ